MSQIKAGTITKNIKQVNVNKVLQEVLNLQEISAEMKQVSLHLKRLDDPYIDIDSDRLQQVTLNLMSNALKFSKKGGEVEIGGEILVEN